VGRSVVWPRPALPSNLKFLPSSDGLAHSPKVRERMDTHWAAAGTRRRKWTPQILPFPFLIHLIFTFAASFPNHRLDCAGPLSVHILLLPSFSSLLAHQSKSKRQNKGGETANSSVPFKILATFLFDAIFSFPSPTILCLSSIVFQKYNFSPY